MAPNVPDHDVPHVWKLWVEMFRSVKDMSPESAAIAAMRSLAGMQLEMPDERQVERLVSDRMMNRSLQIDPSKQRVRQLAALAGVENKVVRSSFARINRKRLTQFAKEKAAAESPFITE